MSNGNVAATINVMFKAAAAINVSLSIVVDYVHTFRIGYIQTMVLDLRA